MYPRTSHWLVAVLSIACQLIPAVLGAAQTAEPPRMLELKIGGQSHRIVPGQKMELDLSGKTEIEVHLLPNRLFGHGGVEFQYPAEFVFVAEIDNEMAVWNLDTDIAGLIFEEIPAEGIITAEEIAREIASDTGAEGEFAPREIRLGSQSVKGVEVVFAIDETPFSYEVYPIKTKGGHRFLILQDILDEDGENSRDYFALRKAVTESFRIVEPEARRYAK